MDGVSDLKTAAYLSDDCSPRPDRYSDDEVGNLSSASSNYSSCDGSDFDRYCSANSVLGSASICSSIGNYSGIGEELPSECHISRGKSLRSGWNECEGFSDGGTVNPRANGDGCLNRMNASYRLNKNFNESSSCYGIHGEDNTEKLVLSCFAKGNELSSFSSVSCSQGSSLDAYAKKGILNANFCNSENGTHLDPNDGSLVGIEVNEGVFLQSRLSESEDSVVDYEIDSEHKFDFSKKSFKVVEETKHGDVNPLFISTSAAFGSKDWDEFMQDPVADGLASISLHLDQSFHHKDDHIKKEHEKKVGHVAEASYLTEKLTVMDMQDGNYLSEINHDAQVIDIHRGFHGDKYNVLSSHGATTFDQNAKNLEYISSIGLQDTLPENNDVKWNSNSMPNVVQSPDNEVNAGKGIKAFEKTLKAQPELYVSTSSSSKTPRQSYCRLIGASKEIKEHELDKHGCLLPLINIGDGSSVWRDRGKGSSLPHLAEGDTQEGEIKKVDTYDSYDEMVLEMEEILLDSRKCHGFIHMQSNQGSMSQQSCNFGDGSSIASTSAIHDIYPPIHVPSKIDRVDVIGAKQKKGDVSFGERLVGVREYTIYQIKVWSGTDVWKVERRYRDFFTLYHQLRAFFSGHGLSLPSVWSIVEQDSRKIFGNTSPNVVNERSTLIEDCLRSILNSTFYFGNPSPLIMFLTPGKMMYKSGLFQSLVPQYLQKFVEEGNSDCSKARPKDTLLGKTVSLVVEIKPRKSLRQLLEIQQYACAGCHRFLDAGKTLFRELVQTFGWNRPRFCEYTGQLFCASCHTNDTNVLPARVLHHWDFTKYPVSQLAKAYLESIYDQPMLCVSAVNPFLFSKVPTLLKVMDFRKKIGARFPYINCSFRSSIQKSLGFRRHLLENNDFFALRDLVDLSKGPFAALPLMVENISDLILEHITQQCLICYDSGVACASRQACHDPSSLIFPFQETETERCASCGSIFHKACYLDLLGCPCNNPTAINRRLKPRETRNIESHSGPIGFVERSIQPLVSNPATGFFTYIFTKAKSDIIWKPKNSTPIILMGSLPGSST